MKITAINYKGDSLVLSPGNAYMVEKITGLGAMPGTVNRQKMAVHGSVYNSATVDERNIVMKLGLCQPVAENRQALYDFFPTSLPVTLHFETVNRDCTIVGYTEQNEADCFVVGPAAQISIICPDPFFKAEEAAYEAGATAAAAAIIKSSNPHETGYKVSVAFTKATSNFFLTNQTAGTFMSVIHEFAAGDTLEIDTEERTVYINGANAYNSKGGATWALLQPGENKIVCNPAATIRHVDRYIGL